MRIIGGTHRGRRIVPPAGFRARPTTDFAREGLFNILANRIRFEDAKVLDLFSGTGSISYEFASRGVPVIHLVEMDHRHISGIRKIISDLKFSAIKPVHIDVRAYLKTCTEKYDIIFADPPYDLPWIKEIPGMVLKAGILEEEGFFIMEHPRGMDFKNDPGFFEHRSYGGVNFSFFKQL